MRVGLTISIVVVVLALGAQIIRGMVFELERQRILDNRDF